MAEAATVVAGAVVEKVVAVLEGARVEARVAVEKAVATGAEKVEAGMAAAMEAEEMEVAMVVESAAAMVEVTVEEREEEREGATAGVVMEEEVMGRRSILLQRMAWPLNLLSRLAMS